MEITIGNSLGRDKGPIEENYADSGPPGQDTIVDDPNVDPTLAPPERFFGDTQYVSFTG